MSVQVRRRREASAFLQTYVGAQGELLVDTTNNRVQVHDGVTPGGWPAAKLADLPGRNAIINGNFPINQRAYVSGTALAANAYGHDRWKAGANGCTYGFAQAANDTTITITAGTLLQVVEAAQVWEAAWLLSWTGTAQARVYQGAAGAFSPGTPTSTGLDGAKNVLLVTGLTVGANATVEFSTGTVATAQLEPALPGAGPSNFERRLLAQELAACQRFYEPMSGSLRLTVGSATYVATSVTFKTTKRAAPTIGGFADGATCAVAGKFYGAPGVNTQATGLVFGSMASGTDYYNYGFTFAASAEL